jgi:hypothetical protein
MFMISKSDKRHTFQLEKYIERCKEKGEEPNQEYVEMYKNICETEKHKFDDAEKRINNMEYDLLTTDWILEKVRNSESYAQNLYAAMCNTEFVKNDVWPRLQDQRWGCSWRYAGGIIADMRQEGDYIDWYCSGSADVYGFMSEGYVTDEIRQDLLQLGWIVIDDDNA